MRQKFLNSFYALFLFTGIVQAQQTEWKVDSEADNNSSYTLRQVIANAKAGDKIIFAPTVRNILLTGGQIDINKSLTIEGKGASEIKINGNGIGRIFNIVNSGGDVALKGMLLRNGSSTAYGGAIYTENSNLILTNVELQDNKAQYGGAIATFSGTLIMNNCILAYNTAEQGGALIGGVLHPADNNIVSIIGGRIKSNTATHPYAGGGGGGIRFDTGTLMLDKVDLESNTAYHDGGGIFAGLDSRLAIFNSAIMYNTASRAEARGGGLYLFNVLSSEIGTSTFSGNRAKDLGGAIYNNTTTLINSIDASTVVHNSAEVNGGGIYNKAGTIKLKNTIVALNNAIAGKNIYTLPGSNVLSSGYNLIGQDDATAFTALASDIVGTATAPIDPKIEYPSIGLVHKLLLGSRAYNAGDPTEMYPDQLNQAVFGGRRDIGAHEAQEDLLGNPVFDFKNSSSTVWPNPSNGTIKINLSNRLGSTAKGSLIEIASGKTVSKFTVNGNSEINLQQYAAGLYIVRLESESVTENHKLIIQ